MLQWGESGKVVRDLTVEAIQIVDDGKLVSLPMKQSHESIKTLGEMSNPELEWDDALQEVRGMAERFAWCMRGYFPSHVLLYVWDRVVVTSINYKMLYATVSESQLQWALRPMMIAFRKSLWISSSTPSETMQAFGIGEQWHTLHIDRLMMMFRCMRDAKGDVGMSMEAMMYNELQRRSSSRTLTSRSCRLSLGLSARGWWTKTKLRASEETPKSAGHFKARTVSQASAQHWRGRNRCQGHR